MEFNKNKTISKRKKVALIISALLAVVGVFFLGFFTSRWSMDKDIESLNFILKNYRKNYLYSDSDDNYVNDLVKSLPLDNYSGYFSTESFKTVKSDAEGDSAGMGVVLNNELYIFSVLGNSPAEYSKIKPYGNICGIKTLSSNTWTTLTNLTELSNELKKFETGVLFNLQINYDGVKETFITQKKNFLQTFVRYYSSSGSYSFTDADGEMKMSLIEDNQFDFSNNNDVGLIALSEFNGTLNGLLGVKGQFVSALEKFKEEGKSKLIVDLRNNGGGYVDIMCNLAAHLTEGENGEKKLCMFAKNKNGEVLNYYTGKIDSKQYGFEKIVFLANANTASASEALIGCVLDYDISNKVNVIISKITTANGVEYRTYGKGIMQTYYENYSTGEAIKLTTHKIYWPVSQTCIHDIGITNALSQKIICETDFGSFNDALNILK